MNLRSTRTTMQKVFVWTIIALIIFAISSKGILQVLAQLGVHIGFS